MASRTRIVFAATALTVALGLHGGASAVARGDFHRGLWRDLTGAHPLAAAREGGQQPPPAQQAPPQQPPPADPAQPPVFRTGINFVRVDVIISDKTGNPIADLSQADFDVTEDGK